MSEGGDSNGTPSPSAHEPREDPGLSGPMPEVEGYDITGVLGRGGMGTVWRGVQLSTYRDVALKLLGKGAFGSEKDRLRFEREVELTARLHHPNIADIFDSGVHQGVYYYAMELVDGVPLDKYVEEQGLRQRGILELMRTVCEAVQHAHERGVIHRDLKSSNILVTRDGQPRVLDFGLAKGLLEEDSSLTVSAEGQAAGTPAYMSPEQAAGKLDQIDTRTDVYALGVVLFRLLTGKSPHDLSGTRYEVLRRIAEEEVRRPRDITKNVDRELEALLLKALAHDPKDRYASAGALAQDIQNYLTGEPLTARPPTTIYFLRKRIRKYRLPVAIASSVLAALIGMAVFAYIRIARERNNALLARDNTRKEADKGKATYDFLEGILTSVEPEKALGREITLREALDQAAEDVGTELADQPEVEAAVRMTIGETYSALGQYDAAGKQLSRALKIRRRVLGNEHPDTLVSMNNLGNTLIYQAKLDEAEAMHRQVVKVKRRVLGDEHPDTLLSMHNLAGALCKKDELDEAEVIQRHVMEIRRRVLGEEHPDTLVAMNNLAGTLSYQGKVHEAEALHREALEIQRRVLGEEHPNTLASMNGLALMLRSQGKVVEAEAMHRQVVEISRRILGEEHPVTLMSMYNLANTLSTKGNREDAEAMHRRVLEIRRRVLGEEHQSTLTSMRTVGASLRQKGSLEEAEVMLRKAFDTQRRVLGEEHRDTLTSMRNLADVFEQTGRLSEAKALRKESLEIRQRVLGKEHADRQPGLGPIAAPTESTTTPVGKKRNAEPSTRER